jgi:hypothetical protein
MTGEEDEEEKSLNDEEIEDIEASIVTADASRTEVTEEEFAEFIGDKAKIFFRKFKNFNIRDPKKFALTWNWPAFFFSYVWMAYRKMYAWAACAAVIILLYFSGLFLISFLLSYLPFSVREFLAHTILPFLVLIGFALPAIAFGVAGNYIYFRFCRKRIIEWKNTDRSIPLAKRGGVNPWAAVIALLMNFVFGLL